jgi:putative transposase
MLDATFEKVRENGRVVSMAVLIAVGIRSTGEREILGVDVGPAEDFQFWLSFMRDLVARGVTGVLLVTSDSHLGLKAAVAQVFTGATWQRCRVHFMRNALSSVPKHAQQMVAAMVRTIFAQPDVASAKETLGRVCSVFRAKFPQLVQVLVDAEEDVLAFYGFPVEHRRQIWSTNSLERLNREVGRRCAVVGIFPNRQSLLRLVGAVLEEQERRVGSGPALLQHRVHAQAHRTHERGGGEGSTRARDRVIY